MLADKYVPYNDEWKYKIDVLNTLERIADAVAPVKAVASVKEEEIATLSMEKTVEEKPKARARKKKGDV